MFKALVCHDGVFSTLNQWSTEELFSSIHDFEGTLWENRAGYEKWDPAKFLSEWATPQLVSYISFSSFFTPFSASFCLIVTLLLYPRFVIFAVCPCSINISLLPQKIDYPQRIRLQAAHHRGPRALQRAAV
jgi:hypothetical protein